MGLYEANFKNFGFELCPTGDVNYCISEKSEINDFFWFNGFPKNALHSKPTSNIGFKISTAFKTKLF